VIEVAVGVEFVPLTELGAVRLVGLHERWRADYPSVQEQPALPPGPPPGTVLAPLSFQMSFTLPPLRLWMLAADERTLIQAQHDRLILNWRRLDDSSDAYPRYRTLKPEFSHRWVDFVAYARELGLTQLRPAVAEVTFVNRIPSPDGRKDLSGVLATAVASTLPGHMLQTRVQHLVDVSAPGLPAQMLINAGPDDNDPGDAAVTVTTRVGLQAEPEDMDTILKALDYAHDTGVRGFSQVTDPSMHKLWGRTA
jgi:uncharacterized protein (TIGR04255 family)